MVYHDWSDKNVDWMGIEAAASYIYSYCYKWGRLGGQAKEKYGTVRFYTSFGWLSLHTLIYPGYHFNQFPTWLWKLDIDYISPVIDKLFGSLFRKWQQYIYSKAYNNAVKRWPHLREEILSCADWPECIKGYNLKRGEANDNS